MNRSEDDIFRLISNKSRVMPRGSAANKKMS